MEALPLLQLTATDISALLLLLHACCWCHCCCGCQTAPTPGQPPSGLQTTAPCPIQAPYYPLHRFMQAPSTLRVHATAQLQPS